VWKQCVKRASGYKTKLLVCLKWCDRRLDRMWEIMVFCSCLPCRTARVTAQSHFYMCRVRKTSSGSPLESDMQGCADAGASLIGKSENPEMDDSAHVVKCAQPLLVPRVDIVGGFCEIETLQ
jgi:hypothetical protein